MGASLQKPVTSTVLERHGTKNFRVGLAEMNGWRGSMEDAHVVHFSSNGEAYFGILDGHGGDQCSAWCAKKLHERLSASGLPANDAAAKKMCLEIDQAFLDTGQPSGSTAAMCAVRPPSTPSPTAKYKLHVINAGDSRVLLSRADGTIVEGGGTDGGLTTDHKPDHPGEKARIYRCGGTVQEAAGGVHRVNGDLAVSRGFGDAEYKKTGGPSLEDRPVTANPEMGHFECGASDFLLLVCDGVSEGAFPNAEVCQLAASVLAKTGGDAAAASEAICFKAIETGSKDNISCMIVLMGGAPLPTPAASSPAALTPKSVTNKSVVFCPGSLLGTKDTNFVKAYVAMCARGGVSFGTAVQRRHALLRKRQGTAHAEAEDEAELALIGSPNGAEGSPQRTAWFVEWAEQCQARKEEGGGDDGDGDGDGDGGRMKQLMMMRMLMQMMQSDGTGRAGP